LLIGTNRRLLVVNHTALEHLGLDGVPAAWMQRPLAEMLDQLGPRAPEMVEVTLEEMRRMREGDETVGEGELEINGSAVRWTSLPVMAGETALGRLIVLQDVTQERMLQRMRDDLTHTMVHDLRNPLNVVSSALEMLEDQIVSASTSAQVAQMMEIARGSTQRMLALVNDILKISQMEEGRMPLVRRPVDAGELVETVLKGQRPLALEKELVLENGSAENELPLVFADPGLIERVLQNLIGNAIKFTPSGGKITVSTAVDGDKVRIAVDDSGPGVRPEMQEQLFQKFVTGEEGERGSGLGLAFCRMAIEAHEGEIWVESAPGVGATFVFTLPQIAGEAGTSQPLT
jgi:signal transduction histidine kinase